MKVKMNTERQIRKTYQIKKYHTVFYDFYNSLDVGDKEGS